MYKQVKELRIKKGLTQEQLAERLNVSRPLITRIELGQITPSVPVAKRIGKELDFNWTKFYD